MLLRKMFGRMWWFTTLLVLLGGAVCIRLGIWQLDRLDQRRAYNTHMISVWSMDPVELNSAIPEDIQNMEYRSVHVSGEYDFPNQVALRNQYYENQPGYHLMTPLLFDGKAVLVDRGWVPAESSSLPQEWREYDGAEFVDLKGQIRLGQNKPTFGGVADTLPADGSALWVWNNVDVEKIVHQLPYPVLGFYIQPDVDAPDDVPPIPYQPKIELTEGPHLGYALQWFTFATILVLGYPFYLRKQE